MGENEEILENIEEVLEEPAIEMPEEMIMPKSDEEMVEDFLRNLERNHTTFYGTIEELADEIMLPFPTVNDIVNKWEMEEKIEKHANIIEDSPAKEVIFFKK